MELGNIAKDINSQPSGNITIAKDASNRERFISFFKNLLKKKNIKKQEKPTQEEPEQNDSGDEVKDVKEVAPKGREKQVRKLKKVLPKTYKDKSGKRKKSNPYKVAYSQASKKLKEQEGEVRAASQEKTTGEVKPGVVPPQPTEAPQMVGDDIDILATDYKNVKAGNYQFEWRIKKEGETVKAEIVIWEVSDVDKKEKSQNLKFHSSFIVEFPSKEVFETMAEHWRWQFGQFLKTLKSMP